MSITEDLVGCTAVSRGTKIPIQQEARKLEVGVHALLPKVVKTNNKIPLNPSKRTMCGKAILLMDGGEGVGLEGYSWRSNF